MRLKHHQLSRRFALTATAATLAMAVALAWGTGVSFAAPKSESKTATYYEDSLENLCVGLESPPPPSVFSGCEWAGVTGSANTAIGYHSLLGDIKGSDNVASGSYALADNLAGNDNTASGFQALRDNGAGGTNPANGDGNTANGDGALFSNLEGNDNTATGSEALYSNNGYANVASGFEALRENTTGEGNTASGFQALKENVTGVSNTANGVYSLFSNVSGGNNIAIGQSAMHNNISGGDNTVSGAFAMENNKTGDNNVASGDHALSSNEASKNVAIGVDALHSNTSGGENLALGNGAGNKLTTGSNNIDIANEEGVAAEANTTRIGTEKTQTRAFMAGIYQKTTNTPVCPVTVSKEGQLGCNPAAPAGSSAIATFVSRTAVPTGNCLKSIEMGPAGHAGCPASPIKGYSVSTLLDGPTPANGATVSDLYADTNATLTGTETTKVEVIDNTTGTPLLECTVNSTTKTHCENAGPGGNAAAGDNIEVKVTATGTTGAWRVRFRY